MRFTGRLLAMYRPRPITQRLLVQRGVLSVHPAPRVPLESRPIELEGLSATPNLIRFIVPGSLKDALREHLDKYGVNAVSLFPDLDGLSRYVNWETDRIGHSRVEKLSRARGASAAE